MWTVALCLLAFTTPQQKSEPSGAWRAWVVCPGGEIPFTMQIRGGEQPHVVIENGAERIDVADVELSDDGLTLSLEPYDSKITAHFDDERTELHGTWRKRRGADRWSEMEFHAEKGDLPRFGTRPTVSVDQSRIDGRWHVQFEKDSNPAVGVFRGPTALGSKLTGTFLTTLGDYRYLAGDFADDTLRLSCFDGGHAFLFTAKRAADGTLKGDFWSSNSWHETWTAKRDPEAALPDAFALTQWNDDVDLGSLRYPDLDGHLRTLADPEFVGKARIIQVFGSWCPNCNDASKLLAEFDNKFRARGLRILGLAFEHTGDHERDAEMVRQYRRRHGCRYPVLLAGPSDKKKASAAFPALDRVRSYPTTIFLDRNGRVRAIHTGFSGPATGREHQLLREKFTTIVEDLLGGG